MITDRDTDGLGYALGMKAEEVFKQVMQERGWTVTDANKQQNMIEHWDFRIVKGDWNLTVDVKAQKRINRRDEAVDNKWLWIELRNVVGEPGWVHRTKADFLAFERDDMFLFVKPADLRKVLEEVVIPMPVETAGEAHYSIYQRKDRNDELTLIRYADLPVTKVVPKYDIPE